MPKDLTSGLQSIRFSDISKLPKGVDVGEIYDEATEVISMGAEHFSDPENMFRLYQADPEHFFMILSLTRTTY